MAERTREIQDEWLDWAMTVAWRSGIGEIATLDRTGARHLLRSGIDQLLAAPELPSLQYLCFVFYRMPGDRIGLGTTLRTAATLGPGIGMASSAQVAPRPASPRGTTFVRS